MFNGAGGVGSVVVHTTQGRGATPEEIADRALAKIIFIADSAHPALKEQAQAFRENIRAVLVFYLNEAVRSRDVTLTNKLRTAGLEDIIPILDS